MGTKAALAHLKTYNFDQEGRRRPPPPLPPPGFAHKRNGRSTSTVDAGGLFDAVEVHPWAEDAEILEHDASMETPGGGRTFRGGPIGPVSATLKLKPAT